MNIRLKHMNVIQQCVKEKYFENISFCKSATFMWNYSL